MVYGNTNFSSILQTSNCSKKETIFKEWLEGRQLVILGFGGGQHLSALRRKNNS
jgi:hypothetical protein